MMTLNHMGLDLHVCELYSSKLGYVEIELYFFLMFLEICQKTLQLHICKLSLTQDWSSYDISDMFLQDSKTQWNIKDTFALKIPYNKQHICWQHCLCMYKLLR